MITALQWIESYLKNRSQKVAIGDLGADLSLTYKVVTLTFRALQGSVLGPIFYIIPDTSVIYLQEAWSHLPPIS